MFRKDMLILHEAGIVRNVNKKHTIRISDSKIKYIYYLQKGLIKILNIGIKGEETIKYLIKPGSIFGELNLLDNEENKDEIAVAVENSKVCFIPIETIKALMENNISFRRSINFLIGQRIKKLEERLLSMMLKNVKERILDFLNEFTMEFGHPVNGGHSANFFITHDDIARITATTRQTVTTSMVIFKKAGLIDYNNKKLSVYNFQHTLI